MKITTSAPYAGLLYDLAYYYNYIVPKALIDANNDFSANPVGTGPYKLKEWNLGNYISLERHDDYFDEAHKAKIPNLVFNIIPEGDFPYGSP
ncbi:MAG: ABC transporter substrate-binding protein [Oscillospiraceae bacterium]